MRAPVCERNALTASVYVTLFYIFLPRNRREAEENQLLKMRKSRVVSKLRASRDATMDFQPGSMEERKFLASHFQGEILRMPLHTHNKTLRLVTGLSLLLLLVSPFSQASDHPPRAKQVFITPFLAVSEATDDFSDGDSGPGIGIGWAFTDNWAIEGLYFETEPDLRTTGHADAKTLWLNALYSFNNSSDRWQPYVTFGAGRVDYDNVAPFMDRNDTQVNAGLGLFANVSKRVGFRADLRGVYNDRASEVTPMALLGMTFTLGRFPEERSAPAPAPAVAAAAPVDTDGDGVVDGDDRCPGTPAGEAVDAMGCELDDDGDGVVNRLDECPDTEAGARVDSVGCYEMLEETITIDLNLEFPLNSDALQSSQHAEIDTVAEFLKAYPTASAVIEGHTDASGPADYNQALSERRANAVLDYLVAAGIDADRLTAVGYGEAQPIDTNDTEEGRAHNRRVSAALSATTNVRR
jgi:OOP family OmpA-OmpF porin